MKNVVCGLLCLVAMFALTGCTDWHKKFQSLDAEHQNLKGLYEDCVSSMDSTAMEKARLEKDLDTSRQTIDQLQKQIESGKSAAKATGFEGMDVAVDAKAGTITVTLSDAILFASGSAKLKNASIAELDKIYSVVQERYSGRKLDIVGHTDSDPIRKTKDKWQDNWDLSAQRSLTVVRYMINKGIDDKNIRAVGCGESLPVASNSTAAGKSQNRRVEVVVNMR